MTTRFEWNTRIIGEKAAEEVVAEVDSGAVEARVHRVEDTNRPEEGIEVAAAMAAVSSPEPASVTAPRVLGEDTTAAVEVRGTLPVGVATDMRGVLSATLITVTVAGLRSDKIVIDTIDLAVNNDQPLL